MRYVITGASRGIGLEFVQQLLRRGDTVEAGVRSQEGARRLEPLARESGGRLRIHPLDVEDAASIRSFTADLSAAPVDVLINNAGVFGQACAFADVDYADAARTFAINALGPLRVTSALLPALRQGTARRVAHISSIMGSIATNTEGGSYAYRMSKAALNAGVRSLSHDLGAEGFVTVMLHPGWVRTDMGGPQAPLTAADSVRGLLRLIDGLGPEHSGRFLDYQGREIPW